ncbi:leucine-rich repeat domain-containing protein [Sediminitomix flava]|uniref:Leucine rich repeat (LRR) protein n=1 Tax=Sediminitomix flava TaxID=379075 RepID=A0A315ZCE5_SEDFL|nr:leucine-rich repeat domain-containing protein [Sediminitomix flava]PWJ42990.1 leucine rich repeat (LRR) protein [Sediminitomix flava]
MERLFFATFTKKLVLLFAILFSVVACKEDEEIILPPVLSIESIAVIPNEGGLIQIKYMVENPVEGQEVVLTTATEWVGEFDYSLEGVIQFNAEKSNQREERLGEITFSYEGAESVTIAISQDGNPIIVSNVGDDTDPTMNNLTASIIAVFGEDYATTNESIVVVGSMNQADFNSLATFAHVDLSDVDIVGEITIHPSQPNVENAVPLFAFLPNFDPSQVNDKLKTLKLPNEATIVGAAALGKCIELEEVSLPDEVVRIDVQAFASCLKLKNIASWGKLEVIGVSAFSSCVELDNLELPNTLHTIHPQAFVSCTSLTEVVLPESMETIIGNVFAACSSLRSFSAPDHLDFSDAYYCFFRTALEEFEINSATKHIQTQFLMSTNLKSLDIPATVESLASEDGMVGSFADIQELTEITVHWTENIPTILPLVENPDKYNVPDSDFLGTFPEGFGLSKIVGIGNDKYTITIPKGTKEKYLEVAGWETYNLVEAE